MRIRAKLAAATVLAFAVLTFAPPIASAHEEGHAGPITMAVGFGTEPDAYAGLPNSVQIILTRGETPIVDLGDELKVTVRFGDQTSEAMVLEPFFEVGEFGTPGDYRAFFVPSQPGDYTFHFTGTVEGTKIDKSFTSGPKTFSSVKDISGATFPPVEYPTNANLASRVQKESERTSTALATLTSAANDARDAASDAKTVGVAGIVVGALGLMVGAVAIAVARKRS